MMNSLFSSFDPMSGYSSLNYMVIVLLLAKPIISKLFMMKNYEEVVYNMMMNFLNSEMKLILNSKNLKDKTYIFISIFFSLLILNLTGLLPYIFSMTAHLAYTLTLALPFWLSFILFNLKNSFQSFFAHLVPMGTPMLLSHFMVLIESVSQLIRPITLSVRLAANITAGHILITLLSNVIYVLSPASLALLLLVMLEVAVAFIQSYVFTLLLVMYLSETYDTKP